MCCIDFIVLFLKNNMQYCNVGDIKTLADEGDKTI